MKRQSAKLSMTDCTKSGWTKVLKSIALVLCAMRVAESSAEDALTGIQVDPTRVELNGPLASFSVLVQGTTSDGRLVDLTRVAKFEAKQPEIVALEGPGVLHSVSDGQSNVSIQVGEFTASVEVTVRESQSPRVIHFANDVIPILSKFACNSGGCHGKAEGQNGFKLSVFGFDPEADYRSLVMEGRGRRLFPPAPRKSLLLQKVCGEVPHGGGIRIARDSYEYRLLYDWIEAGMPVGAADAPVVTSLKLTPGQRRMQPNSQQQLRAVAVYSDGHEVDVTRHATYQSNNDVLASVDERGLVSVEEIPGEVAVMANYMGAVGVFRVVVPRPKSFETFPQRPIHNFIDTLVDNKLRQLNVAPAELCTDSEYLRRVYLDVIGTLPTSDETREFLSDRSPDKRHKLVERLLNRSEYADYWSLKWSDLLRVDREALGQKAAYNYYTWIRDRFADNTPFDRFAFELVAVEGPLKDAPAGYLYKVVTDPGKAASTISQVFLGVRIECAQCHHHPFDRWSQSDYFGMKAHFTQVGFKPSSGGELIAALKDPKTTHPRTDAEIFAYPLGTTMPEASPAGDRRRLLAEWMIAPENQWFARSTVNRYWAHFLGRGLVEPVDDFRSTNPPSNPELLDALAAHFVEHQFDLHDLIRTIVSSRTYQLSSEPNESNAEDEQNYSRALFRRLDAEVVFDAVCEITGVPEKFDGIPQGVRAIQLWDSQVPHYFLRLFGRPVRSTACECERQVEPSVSQVLHILNSPQIQNRLSHAGGRIRKLESAISDDKALVEELYLTCYSRQPSQEELELAVSYLKRKSSERPTAVEDVVWSMMNTVEFLFNH